MLETLYFLLLPVSACIILVGIFSYFGLHVLARGVIFVDISMAQIAALGTLVGMLVGIGQESVFSYLFSVLFVGLAAAVFTFIRLEAREVPQEAIIGIVYGLSLAFSLFIAELVPEGAGYIKETLTGSLLWVNWGKIALLGLVCAVIGIFHYVYRDRLIALARDKTQHTAPGARKWDFLFYFTLGLVVIEAVKIVGVFLVFSLLVVPASMAVMFYPGWKGRLVAAWVIGGSASVLGTMASYRWNLPNAPFIVCLLGLALVVAALVKILLSRSVHAEDSGEYNRL
ncbi:MAG TPA: metal ABC transporter permease [archaeon]|nr:metal ABC transporter permease [archaeon]